MIKNAFSYVTRKGVKSLIICLVILFMSTLSIIGLSIKDATNVSANKSFSSITNSFTMEINRQYNFGTPRGAGNIKGQDINKITNSKDIDSCVKRINSVADLENLDLVQASNVSSNPSKNFNRTVMLTGVNDSKKESKFVSGAYKLVSGKHLTSKDSHQVLIHKDLAQKNGLKVGDTFWLKSNLYDADNEKGADERVKVKIKGLFDGHNSGGVTAAQELYENNLITDLDTAAKVYGNTRDTAVYQDATFFVKGNKDLDRVMKNIEKLDIDWKNYVLIKSTSNYPALQQSISSMYSIANKLFIGSIIFAGVVVALLLLLWMNARKKEIAIFMSIGISKGKIFIQFVTELIMISIPAYIGSYFLASYTGQVLGNHILSKVTSDIARQISSQASSSQLGAGAEVDGFNKTLTSIDIHMEPQYVIYVVAFMSLVLLVSLILSSLGMLNKSPRELLNDEE